ncbi:hypothetical protein A343_0034, partial [Porphyromonas gingivalis JCVI SC001]
MLASHDPVDTLSWANEIVVIQSGKIVQQGAPLQVYTQPINEYVAGLFGSYNLIPAANASPLYQFTGVKKGKDIFFRPEDVKLMK